MLWLILSIFYVAKLSLLIYVQVKNSFNYSPFMIKIRTGWITMKILSYCMMLIGLIYDTILLAKGDIANVVPMIISFLFCFIYFLLSISDYVLYDKIEAMIFSEPRKIVPNPNEDQDKESNKTKSE